ncbi:MAG: glycosyltransferase, partial [Chloroflexi bacterium]|nr:glycosyltransferase [Chloroflexota bacterium]
MRFAVVGPTYPFRGGIAHYTTLLVRHLRALHDVRFYSYRRQYPHWLFPGNTASDPSSLKLEEPCEHTLDTLNPLTWLHTARHIARAQPDVLLLQWWTPFWLPLYACLIAFARRAHIPIVYLCHQLVEPDSSKYEWLLARLGLRWGDGLVGVTAAEVNLLRKSFPDKLVSAGFLPLFDSFPHQHLNRAQARHQLGIGNHDPVLLFFGFVRRYKGLSYLLEALSTVAMPVRLVVAGEFWEDEQLYRDLIARNHLSERVTIHNRYIPNEEVARYFIAADALALPYLSGSQSAVAMTALHYG